MLFHRPSYLFLFAIVFATTVIITGCSRGNDNDNYIDPHPFPELPEDNTGSRTRSVTYVYDRTALDPSHPPKIDSSVILFSYNAAGQVDRMRFNHSNFVIYDFSFERSGNRLTAIHCKSWFPYPNPKVGQLDVLLEYNASGKVSLMKIPLLGPPHNEVDSFVVKWAVNRIDTVIHRRFMDKYAFTYNASGDIIQMDKLFTSGNSFSYAEVYKYTLSAGPAAIALGDDAIFWYFFTKQAFYSAATNHLVPPILFHSSKQPSKLVLQKAAFPTGTSNYQIEYYPGGRPKKMTADVITQAGAFYAREAYYYTYAQ